MFTSIALIVSSIASVAAAYLTHRGNGSSKKSAVLAALNTVSAQWNNLIKAGVKLPDASHFLTEVLMVAGNVKTLTDGEKRAITETHTSLARRSSANGVRQ